MDASDFGFVLRGVGDSMSWLLGTRENCSFANQAFLHSSISLCLRFLGTDADCCNWAGVHCNETTNRVTELVLWNSVDPGSGGWYLNASLFLPFKDLTSLVLYGNKILGCIENEGFDKLSRLAHLEYVDLADNEFNSSILSCLSSLKTLDLSYNRLKGKVDIQGYYTPLTYAGFDKLSRLPFGESLFSR